MKTENTHSDVRKLVTAIHALGPVTPSVSPEWTKVPALKVIDCVLSLNRKYDSFVVPRRDNFEATHPDVVYVRDLRRLIDACSSPTDFLAETLNYRHPQRADVLSQVVDRLLEIIASSASPNEVEALRSWAEHARPSDHRSWGIRGFALSGFQYLRMLFGANTVKPDVHIRRWVSDCIGRQVGPEEALDLLEIAARQTGKQLRDVDTTIWECSARGRNGASSPVAEHRR